MNNSAQFLAQKVSAHFQLLDLRPITPERTTKKIKKMKDNK